MSYLSDLAERIRLAVPADAGQPQGETDSLYLIYAVLLLAKGTDVTREDVHNAWAAWATARGDVHESLIPFEDLSAEVRAEDSPYVLAIRTVAAEL